MLTMSESWLLVLMMVWQQSLSFLDMKIRVVVQLLMGSRAGPLPLYKQLLEVSQISRADFLCRQGMAVQQQVTRVLSAIASRLE